MDRKLSPEEALGYYADKVQANEEVDLKYFEERMSASDYSEFTELIPFVDMVKASKERDKFNKMFANINRKNRGDAELGEDFPLVAGFRADNTSAISKESMEVVNRIFNEVFGDDEE